VEAAAALDGARAGTGISAVFLGRSVVVRADRGGELVALRIAAEARTVR
jgi:hypothetical protein